MNHPSTTRDPPQFTTPSNPSQPSFPRFTQNNQPSLSHSDIFKQNYPNTNLNLNLDYRTHGVETNYRSLIANPQYKPLQRQESDLESEDKYKNFTKFIGDIMVENKLVSDKGTNKQSQKSFNTESGWNVHSQANMVNQRLQKNEHSRSKEIGNALIDVSGCGSDRFHKKVQVFSRFKDKKFGTQKCGGGGSFRKRQDRSSSQVYVNDADHKEYARSSQNIKKNKRNSKKTKSGFKGFQGKPEKFSKNGHLNSTHKNPIRNNSQPITYSNPMPQPSIQDKSFESEEYEKIFGKPKSRLKNADHIPITGMSQEMILSNYYPLASMDKKKKKYSTMEKDNGMLSKTRFEKLAKKWMPSKENGQRHKGYNNKSTRKSNKSNYNQPIQIIQQININQVKKNTINIMQYGRKFPNQKKPKPKPYMKKQASVPQRKLPKPKTVPKKPNTNDPYKTRIKRHTPLKNLRYKTNKLKAAHQKMTKSGIIPKVKKHEYQMQSTDRTGYRLKHLKKGSSKMSGIKKKKERGMGKNFGRIKAATTSINKKGYQYGGGNNYKGGYVKKRANVIGGGGGRKGGGNVSKGYKDIQKGYKPKDNKLRDYKNGYGVKKNTRSSNYGNDRSRASKTPNFAKFSPIPRKKQGNHQRTSKTTSMKRPISLYDSKNISKKHEKPEKKQKKRYFFKSQKNKEKQIKREMRLKEEMKKLNEQSKRKKEEKKKIMQYGYNMLEKQARKSDNARELLNIVQKKKPKPKRKTKPKEVKTPTIHISTMPLNKLKHFRDSLKHDKKNNTLSPSTIKKRVQKLSEANSSSENFYLNPNNRRDFILSKTALTHSKVGRAVSFEQSRKLHERRSRKFREKNRMRSLKQRTDKEVKLALEHVEGTLKNIESIRRSGLREKTTRSLSKKIQRFMHERKGSSKITNGSVELDNEEVKDFKNIKDVQGGKEVKNFIEESQMVKVCDSVRDGGVEMVKRKEELKKEGDESDGMKGNMEGIYDICLGGGQKGVDDGFVRSKVIEVEEIKVMGSKDVNDSPEKKIKNNNVVKGEKTNKSISQKTEKNEKIKEKESQNDHKTQINLKTPEKILKSTGSYMNLAIKKHKMRQSLINNKNTTKMLKKNFSMIEKIPKKFTTSFDIISQTNTNNESNQKINREELKTLKDSSKLLSNPKSQKKLKKELFSIQNIKSIKQKNQIERRSQLTESKEETANRMMYSSNIIEKERSAKMMFKKFNSKNPLNRSQGNKALKSKNIEILHIKIEDTSNLASPKNISTPTNLDFIEKTNQLDHESQNEKNFQIYPYNQTPSNKDFINNNKSPSKKSQGRKSTQDQLQSVYSSIGKIKEFVKQNSIIEIKPIKTEDFKYVNKSHKKEQKEKEEDKKFQSQMEVMKKIRTMAKKIKKSRQEKRQSLKLMEITKEMDDIIGQIDKIQKPSKEYLKKLRRSRQMGYISSRDKGYISKMKINESAKRNTEKKPKKSKLTYSSQYITSKDQGSLMYSRLAQQRKARKLNHFKNMMQRPKLKKPEKKESQVEGEDPLKLTMELDDIFKTISGLEQQELGNTYHQQREKKLKTLMRSSKLDNIRRTMNLDNHDSNNWLNTQYNKSNNHFDNNFTMKKCPKCQMYFPLQKIASHCKKCSK